MVDDTTCLAEICTQYEAVDNHHNLAIDLELGIRSLYILRIGRNMETKPTVVLYI